MKKLSLIIPLMFLLLACQEEISPDPQAYECQLAFPQAGESHPLHQKLQEALDELTVHTPAAQVAVQSNDGLMWTSAFGKADIPNDIDMEACHKSMVGSISKVFTAVLILQLQDEGLLDVGDLLSKWMDNSLLSQIPNGDQVTLRDLLKHTSGIPDYLGIEQYVNAANTPYFQETQREKLAYVFGKKPLFEPGDRYSYSNTNYVLLGLVVENIRQMPLWEAVEKFITLPLGVENTVMGTHEQPIPDGTARSYRRLPNGTYQDVHQLAVSDAATGDGGMASNPQELIVFVRALFDGKLLSSPTFNQMITDTVGYGNENYYGLGIDIFETSFGRVYGHNGSTTTYNSFLFHFPDSDVSVAISFNFEATEREWEERAAFIRRLFDLLN